jgi:hypothetical protein
MSFVRVVPIFVLFVTCLSGCQSKTLRGWDYGINPDAPPIYINRDSGFWDPEGEGVRDAFGEVPQDLPAACEGDGCPDTICSPGVRTCDLNTAVICLQDGRSFHEVPCNELICIEGQCLACLPGEKECSAENQARRCQADGLGWDETTDCGDKKCVSGECVFCIPGMRTCVGSEVHQCNAGSTDYEPVEDCDTENTGRMCHLGMCIDLCAYNDKFATNLGCEYWAIDMDQSEENDGQNSPFAIVVSNTNEFFTATVKVEKWDGEETTIKAPPKTATVISLEPYNIVGVRQEKLARRVTSNLPIVAYQFNPLENVGVFSNDASLLLPTNALGTKYIVMSWPHRPGLGTLASNFAVVGTSLTPTTVTIRVSAKTAAGGTVPALNAGDTWTTTLAQYEVLNIETLDSFTDLTGSSVEAIDGRVALFGGHVCANAPMSTCKMGMCSYDVMGCSSDSDCPVIGACDHLEEQIQPHAA